MASIHSWSGREGSKILSYLKSRINLLQANYCIGTKQSSKARLLLDKAIDNDPDCVDALLLKSALCLEEGEPERTIELTDRCIELEPNEVDSYKMRAQAYLRVASMDKALKDADRAIELSKSDDKLFALRGSIKKTVGFYESAIADYSEAIKLNPLESYYTERAALYLRLYKTKEAINDCNTILEKNPHCLNALLNRANAFMRNFDFDGASSDIEVALVLHPDKENIKHFQIELLRMTGKIDEALESCLSCLEDDSENASLNVIAAKIYRTKYDFKKALTHAKIAYQANSNDAQVLQELVLSYKDQREFDKALEIVAEFEEKFPKTPVTSVYRSSVLILLGKHEEALQSLTSAIDSYPNVELLYLARGHIKNKIGDKNGALADYDKILQLNHRSYPAMINRAQALIRIGRDDEALVVLNNAKSINRYDPSTFTNSSQAFRYLKQFDKALLEIDKAIELREDYVSAYLNRALIYLRQGKIGEALEQAEFAYKLNPQDHSVLTVLAEVYIEQEKHDQAIELLSQAIEWNPYSGYSYWCYYLLAKKKNQLDEVNENKKRALELGYRPD